MNILRIMSFLGCGWLVISTIFAELSLISSESQVSECRTSYVEFNTIIERAYCGDASLCIVCMNQNWENLQQPFDPPPDSDNSTLRLMVIGNKELQTIDKPAFDVIANGFRMVDVNIKNNDKYSIVNDEFTDFKRLQSLNLRQNGLTKISETAFKGCNNLEKLDLAFNRLEKFKISGVPKLKDISLVGNRIKYICEKSFTSLPAVLAIDLHKNSIVRLKKNALDNLDKIQQLHVSGNRLDKTCIGMESFNKVTSDGFTVFGGWLEEDNTTDCVCLSEAYLHQNVVLEPRSDCGQCLMSGKDSDIETCDEKRFSGKYGSDDCTAAAALATSAAFPWWIIVVVVVVLILIIAAIVIYKKVKGS